ncbi:DNA repair protein RadC [Selenomonadales bacterium OttesenSCG-928-I06]|nr:DNA repair protein RadC [Selenomonadales bacterium OttesenSCG-928-I06]
MAENLHKGHRLRVKKRFLKEGLDGFADHQILEFLLYYAIPMKDTNELAHKILKEFGSISNVFEAHPNDIMKRCNVTENIAILISLVPHLAKRYNQDKWGNKPCLNTSSKVGNYAIDLFTGRVYESFFLICLDNQGNLNNAVLLHEGTIDEVSVYPRLVVEAAIRYNAAMVVLAHNHPSGSLVPSDDDKSTTIRVRTALNAISVRLIDHIIVAGTEYYSFSENGFDLS